MSERASIVTAADGSLGTWDRFWFLGTTIARVAMVRGMLCLIAAIYFLGCWSDAGFWYADGGPLSVTRVAAFLRAGDLEGPARWIVSPLFLADSLLIYRLFLVAGVMLAALVAAGRGGRIAAWALWLLVVSVANRAMILSGLSETLLSLGLFAAAIAPPAEAWTGLQRRSVSNKPNWLSGLSERLIATQITLIGAATFVTMLGGRVWFNGLGSYALVAPAEDRTIDWTVDGSLLANPLVHESLTHLMIIALPIGFALAWRAKTNRIGQAVLVAWCVAVAVLGSHWLYAMTFATMVLAIDPRPRELHDSDQ